jgi:8-oxo-dGTP pyrophosphatase MutT (NUDIX family)
VKLTFVFKQSGVIPYRSTPAGVEVLLVTSSGRKRWVIPKGLVEPFMTPADSAAKEAQEEAGVLGRVVEPAIGSYEYRKWRGICRVEVFLMQVETELADWDEAHLRKRQWMSASKAIKRVEAPELKQMLATLKIPVPTP